MFPAKRWSGCRSAPVAAGAAGREAAKKPKKGLVSRVAKMMEEDDGNEIAGINALPPRVSKDEAYHPAKTPQKNGKRKR